MLIYLATFTSGCSFLLPALCITDVCHMHYHQLSVTVIDEITYFLAGTLM